MGRGDRESYAGVGWQSTVIEIKIHGTYREKRKDECENLMAKRFGRPDRNRPAARSRQALRCHALRITREHKPDASPSRDCEGAIAFVHLNQNKTNPGACRLEEKGRIKI